VTGPMRVGLDATPLLGLRTGVGRYVAGLVEGFGELAAAAPGGRAPEPELPEELVLVPFTWRGARDLPAVAAELAAGTAGVTLGAGTAGVTLGAGPAGVTLGAGPAGVAAGAGAAGVAAGAGAAVGGAAVTGAAGPSGATPGPAGEGGIRVRCGRRRVPARLLAASWARAAWPPVEWLAGRVEVFHATNFACPPARRAATVVTVHDLTYLRYPGMVTAASARYRELVPRGLARGALVCTPTAAVAAEVAGTYQVAADRVVVTPLGVGPAWRSARPPDPGWLAGHGLPARYLLFVGSREPRKGLDVLLAAYRELLADQPGVPPLVLAGPPGWGAALDLAGLPDGSVRLLGYLPESELASLTAGAAAMVFPSRYEGFGLPPLQALACGTPVVASDLPALREVLGDEADLVPAGDAGALAAALATVLKDAPPSDNDAPPSDAARAARRARAARFTWPACAAATLTAYHRAVEERR
jgi:glycosyltransferase involved in cell wall biosynthesis